MKIRSWIKAAPIAVVAAASLALTGCSGSDSQANADGTPSTITIGYQLVPNGDLVVKNQKLLEKAFGDNVKIEWKLFDSGGSVNQAVLAKGIDIGLAGSSPVSRGLSSDVPYQVPWIHDVIGSNEALVVKSDRGINSLADLKGKTIATPFASTSHFSLLAALKDAGIDAADVKIIDSEPDAITAAWHNGDIDGAYVWNPNLAKLEAEGGKVLIDSSAVAAKGNQTYDLAVVSNDFASKYPKAVQTWVDQENAAVTQLKAKSPEAVASIAAELGVSNDEATKQISGLEFLDATEQKSATYLAGGLAKGLFGAAQFNKGLGQIPSVKDEGDYTKAVVATYAEAAK